MKIIDRYIALAVIAATFTALLVVVGLDAFFTLIGQVDDVGKGEYTLLKMLAYIALTIPGSLYELFPVAALLGSVAGMGVLASNSELIAMRASGISIWRIVVSVMQAGLIMLVVVVLIGEFIAPATERYGQEIRSTSSETKVSFMGNRGLWVRDGNLYINARQVISSNELAGITVYEVDDQAQLIETTKAAHARYQDGRWLLKNVKQSTFDKEGVQTHKSKRLVRNSLLTPKLLGIVVIKPEDMSARDISQFMTYLEDNGLSTKQYHYAFLSRFTTPLSAMVMLFISVPFVFGGLRSASAGQRIFLGILVGFSFYIVSQIAGQMGRVYDINPFIATMAPSALFLMAGIYAVRRL